MPSSKRIPLALALLLEACSLDYEQVRVEEAITAQTPDTILIHFRHTIVAEGRVWVVLEAQRAESFEKRKEIVLTEVRFQEFDLEGDLLTEGRAQHAVFNTETEDGSFEGSIYLYSPEEETELQADRLRWVKEGKVLSASPGDTVRLLKKDGSFVEGRGFEADFRRKRLRFEGAVRGSYVWEPEEEE